MTSGSSPIWMAETLPMALSSGVSQQVMTLTVRRVGRRCQHLMTYASGMPAARARNADATRADILSAARARFGTDGYERTTLRAVAADVGVDAALVIRYFGSKQDLFAAAAEFTLDLPDLRGLEPAEM